MRKIRLTESQFNRLVKNCVKKALKESTSGVLEDFSQILPNAFQVNIDKDSCDVLYNNDFIANIEVSGRRFVMIHYAHNDRLTKKLIRTAEDFFSAKGLDVQYEKIS